MKVINFIVLQNLSLHLFGDRSSWPSTLSCDMPTLMQTLTSETNSHSVCVSDVAVAIHEKGVITRQDRQWSSMLHVLALSKVIRAEIKSVYPVKSYAKSLLLGNSSAHSQM